jgi:F-box and WD-40 domain protein 1/11
MHPRLHIDPVHYLPAELTAHVFSFLPHQDILKAAQTSRAWRTAALDPSLWKLLYHGQGWQADKMMVRKYEDEIFKVASGQRSEMVWQSDAVPRLKRSESDHDAASAPKKQKGKATATSTEPTYSDNSSPNIAASAEALAWAQQNDMVEADSISKDVAMEDVSYDFSSSLTHYNSGEASSSKHQEEFAEDEDDLYPASSEPRKGAIYSPTYPYERSANLEIAPTLTVRRSMEVKVNWQYLFKQRQRLEDNWTMGRFTNFQLPHPSHPHEAHLECIYTIQYSGKYLVSGSRDRTLRIWDLQSQRLVRKPLYGHDASVLCSQFDESPEQDVIISGSSDTNVIIWRFSTGEIIKKLINAHDESVLNLRFDNRYLVTCSKDKLIKVWSRQPVMFGDADFVLKTPPTAAGRAVVQPHYVLLKVLRGHAAAVNAIQLNGDEIASASGDRTIKIWSISRAVCLMTLSGHNKGIACIQYDGRRIISGSSDNTIRIFDRVTGSEVSRLEGHNHLVRTVQATFGDLPWSKEEDQLEARLADEKILAMRSAHNPRDDLFRQRMKGAHRSRNTDHGPTIFGAALPVGGGGGKLGRIVSGSYDESVIIWRRDPENKWVINHRLKQVDALAAAANRHNSAARFANRPISGGSTEDAAQQALLLTQQQQRLLSAQQSLATAEAGSSASSNASLSSTPVPPSSLQAVAATNLQLQQQSQPTHHGTSRVSALAAAHQAQQNQRAGQSSQMQTELQPLQHSQSNLSNELDASTTATHAPTGQNAQGPTQSQQSTQPPTLQGPATGAPTVPTLIVPAAGGGVPANHPPAVMSPHGGSARVFKLQFDYRQIIACSQDHRIVGWDFANDDAQIVEACQFFRGV